MTTTLLRCHSIWEDEMLVEFIPASRSARYRTMTNSRNNKWSPASMESRSRHIDQVATVHEKGDEPSPWCWSQTPTDRTVYSPERGSTQIRLCRVKGS